MSRGDELTAAPWASLLRFGPVRARVTLSAPAAVREVLVRRWSSGAASDRSADTEVWIEAERTELFYADRPGFAVERDAGALVRHDFRVRRAESRWVLETVAVPESVEAAMRLVVGIELLARGGLLLHGSSVIRGGFGHVFVGPSGSGKTTIALEGGFDRVLCDELSLVAPDTAGRFRVWPSPFWGSAGVWPALERGLQSAPGIGGFSRPPRAEARGSGKRTEVRAPAPDAPLAGVWLLAGWDETSAQPVPPADAALAILERALDGTVEADGAALALAAAGALVDQVPVRVLRWRRGDALDVVLTPTTAPREAA